MHAILHDIFKGKISAFMFLMICKQNEIKNLKPLTFLSDKCTINLKVYYATGRKLS